MAKYNWAEAAKDYIEGKFYLDDEGNRRHKSFTLKDISETHNIPYDAVKHRSSKEGWKGRKDFVSAYINEKLDEDRLHTFVSDSASINASSLDKINKIHKILNLYLQQYEDIFNVDSLDDIDDPDVILELQNRIKISDLDSITRLIERCQQTAQRIVNAKQEALADSGIALSELSEVLSEAGAASIKGKGRVDAEYDKKQKEAKLAKLLQQRDNRLDTMEKLRREAAALKANEFSE